MEQIFFTAFLWLAVAVLSALIANRLDLSIALVEICAGVAFAYVAGWLEFGDVLGANSEWVRFLASAGAVVLTFLAGAELDPDVLRSKVAEVGVVGFVGFLAPFLGCAAVAFYGLGWNADASWLCGVALSTTSMAVVYAVMLETGFNKTEYGKGILGACFINDLATVIVLGLLFAPFTYKTVVFIAASALVLISLPTLTGWLTQKYAHRTAAIRTKWVVLVLFGLGTLALWSGSEAVLPAYLVGMALAGNAARDVQWIYRLRTLTIGFLTPFYFIRAGTLVSVPALLTAPAVFLALLGAKVASKIFGLYPVIGLFRRERKERWYYTLLMSTGLTFGTISALYGLAHGIVTQEQYSFLVAAVIASAVVPTAIAGLAFVPSHLLQGAAQPGQPVKSLNSFTDEG
jgi:glutathione-regulated potassium-efflux system ancillary protein KefC